VIAWRAVCSFGLHFTWLWCGTWTRRCLGHGWGDSWLVVYTWWYELGGSYPDTVVWGYEQEGPYVLCSHLRDAVSGEVLSWWITCIGRRAGRSVELDYE